MERFQSWTRTVKADIIGEGSVVDSRRMDMSDQIKALNRIH